MHRHPSCESTATLVGAARPFTRAQARSAGLSPGQLRSLLASGAVRRVLHGVYVADTVRETLELRVASLRLVVPRGAVVVDETAGWLHEANMILAPAGVHDVPPVHVFQRTAGQRLRHAATASGERRLLDRDVQQLDGLQVTTPLRTACDLGRLRHRDRALAAIDSLLGLGVFSHDDLQREITRFVGYRGVVQLRELGPLGDPRAESPGESALRLRWHDACLPEPRPQYAVTGSRGETWWLDLAEPVLRYAAEYDGDQHHSSERDVAHDLERRDFLRRYGGWTIDVLRRADVFGQQQRAEQVLRRGIELARARHRGIG